MRAFYDAAIELGAESLHEPRLWPEYHPGYFGAFVRDPDGNNVEAVFHGAAIASAVCPTPTPLPRRNCCATPSPD